MLYAEGPRKVRIWVLVKGAESKSLVMLVTRAADPLRQTSYMDISDNEGAKETINSDKLSTGFTGASSKRRLDPRFLVGGLLAAVF